MVLIQHSFAKTNELKTELNSLKEGVEVEITYSVDKTGNPENGGDWIMESNQENIKPIYFIEEKINEYHGILDTVYSISHTFSNSSSPFKDKVSVSGNAGEGQTIT